MSYAAYGQEAILGRLLVDIVHGDLTNETIGLVNQLDPEDLVLPMLHLVRYVQGMNMSPHLRARINCDLLDELRIITMEQTADLYPPDPEDNLPTWRLDALIPDRVLPIIKDLLLETLQGGISYETLTAIDDLGELEDVPEPYRELLSLVQSFRQDGQEISDFLLYNLSGVIDQLKLLRR
ncbi:MAG: hypothetical protein C3F07_11915 [Anaerolineales bacterium]|nr:hypothetical protein [Anaerolineae bacterium]PWB72487.1 MAG: hypothetical protein C3F07_11915 [Anaerolineales bacterium]